MNNTIKIKPFNEFVNESVFDEQSIKQIMLDFAKRIQTKLDSGKTLKQINQESFLEREQDPNHNVYLGISEKEGSEITQLYAQPIKSQNNLDIFFRKTKQGLTIKYTLLVTKNKVWFYMKNPDKTFTDLLTGKNFWPLEEF